MVPLAGLRGFLAGRQQIVDSADTMFARSLGGPVDLDLDSGLHVVAGIIGPDEDAAVAFGLELQVEDEVPETLLGPDIASRAFSSQGTVVDDPACGRGFARAVLPAGKRLTVEQQLPSFGAGRLGSGRRVRPLDRGHHEPQDHNQVHHRPHAESPCVK